MDQSPAKKKDLTLIPALAVILAMSAFVAMLAFDLWPTSQELTPTQVIIRSHPLHPTNTNTR